MHPESSIQIPRSSSVTSTSSESSESDSNQRVSIQALTECLHRIHALDAEQNEEIGLLFEALGLVALIKREHEMAMPTPVLNKACQMLKQERRPRKANTELAFLFGRCFNLSMNSKIFSQCHHADASIASRLLVDFEVLESSLRAKLSDCESIGHLSKLQIS